jgi:hypothetical protein
MVKAIFTASNLLKNLKKTEKAYVNTLQKKIQSEELESTRKEIKHYRKSSK